MRDPSVELAIQVVQHAMAGLSPRPNVSVATTESGQIVFGSANRPSLTMDAPKRGAAAEWCDTAFDKLWYWLRAKPLGAQA